MNNKLVAAAVGFVAITGTGVVGLDEARDPYIDKGDRFEIVTGETKAELMKERPEVIFSKWGAEASFSVKYQEEAQGDRKFLTNRVEWGKVHAYPLDPKDLMEDGGLEIEVALDSVPSSNRFDFTIEGADELDFFYQHELSDEEKAGGRSRPENVIGSYAVYHKEKQGNEFKTGKAFHIFRPKAIDANGNEEWCDLAYESGILSVTCSEKWLAKAAYPVRIDPTFGYTSQGASSISAEVGYFAMRGDVSGTVTDINAYLRGGTTATDDGAYLKVFPDSAGSPNVGSASYTSSFQFTPSSTYSLFTVSGLSVGISSPAWVGGCLFEGTGSGLPEVAYDSGGGSSNYAAYSVANCTSGAATLSSDRISTYATYTASGGGGGGGSSGLIFFD